MVTALRKEPKKELLETTESAAGAIAAVGRTVGPVAGGLLVGSLFGPYGALAGGLLGVYAGLARNRELDKKDRPRG